MNNQKYALNDEFEGCKLDTIHRNNSEYDKYFYSKKSDYKKVAWGDYKNQLKNYKLVYKSINNNDSLLDFGCGLGDFLGFLTQMNITITNYLGVDINNNFIESAKNKYPNNDFKIINNVNDITGSWDVICAIGVFTWYIEKEEFIHTIKKLHSLCNKHVLITLLNNSYLKTPYNYKNYTLEDEKKFWSKEYRHYDAELFSVLFPEFKDKLIFEWVKNTILIKILK